MSRFPSLVVLAMAAILSACSSVVEPVTSDSGIMVANATNGPLDIEIDGRRVTTGLSINGLSFVIGVPAESHRVRLLDGVGNATELAVQTSPEALRTVVAYPRTAPGAGTGISAAVLVDSGSFTPFGKSKLRVAHLAANAGGIEIWRSQPDFQSGVRIMTPFQYQATSPYLQSDAGVWEVWLTPVNGQTKSLSTGPIEIPSGERRTVLLLDSAGGPRFVVIAE